MIKIDNLKFKHSKDSNFFINVDTIIEKGTFNTILGLSGSGKSTFINLIAGFLQPCSGEIFIDDRSILNLKPYQRDISLMFQENNVFLHLSIIENIELVLKKGDGYSQEKIDILLQSLNILDYKYQKAYNLSGGQVQRLALAMRLIQNNKIFLLDEPFSALDSITKNEMMRIIHNLWCQNAPTILLASHDYNSIKKYTQNIIFMSKGEILFNGTKEEFATFPNQEIKDYLHFAVS